MVGLCNCFKNRIFFWVTVGSHLKNDPTSYPIIIIFCNLKAQKIVYIHYAIFAGRKQTSFTYTIFPHIIAAATILFWKFGCGKYSKEETIQRRKLLFFYFLLQGGGRKVLHEDMKNEVFEWKNKKIHRYYCLISCKLTKQVDFCLLQLGNLAQKWVPFHNLSLL
jgi:hypothetical protein